MMRRVITFDSTQFIRGAVDTFTHMRRVLHTWANGCTEPSSVRGRKIDVDSTKPPINVMKADLARGVFKLRSS